MALSSMNLSNPFLHKYKSSGFLNILCQLVPLLSYVYVKELLAWPFHDVALTFTL